MKKASVPKTPHMGWRLPWLQVAENKRQQASYQMQMVEIQAANAVNPYFPSASELNSSYRQLSNFPASDKK